MIKHQRNDGHRGRQSDAATTRRKDEIKGATVVEISSKEASAEGVPMAFEAPLGASTVSPLNQEPAMLLKTNQCVTKVGGVPRLQTLSEFVAGEIDAQAPASPSGKYRFMYAPHVVDRRSVA